MTRRQQVRAGAGFFAIGIAGSKTPENLGTLWRTASLYRAALVFTVGKRYAHQCSDTPKTPQNIPLMHFRDMDDLREHLPFSCPLVGVELDSRSVPLGRFSHPRRAAYLLGAEDHGLTPSQRDACHSLVQIETAEPWSMNVAVAGSILLRERYMQAARVTA